MALGLIQEIEDEDESRAKAILSSAIQNPPTIPDAILEILTTIIKPLFSSSKHPQLTETGRKRLVPTPSIPGTFTSDHDSIFDTSRPWKNNWITPLLQEILSKYYHLITPDSVRGKTIESHFHLLVPPILILIDDVDLQYKAKGCDCLSSLGRILISTQSSIMVRTGLADVFIDTLKNNFIHLPPLTPELESLHLLESLYPAFFAVVEASSPTSAARDDSTTLPVESMTSATSTDKNENTKYKTKTPHQYNSSNHSQSANETSNGNRDKNLILLLRHSLLYTLNSMISNSTSSSQSIPIYLLTQLPPLLSKLNPISSRQHLQSIIPLLRRILSDPFIPSAAPELLLAASTALEGVVRIYSNDNDSDSSEDETKDEKNGEARDIGVVIGIGRWWTECLHATVSCWMNLDDDEYIKSGDEKIVVKMDEVRIHLRNIVMLLRNEENKDDFDRGSEEIIREEVALGGLFEVVTG